MGTNTKKTILLYAAISMVGSLLCFDSRSQGRVIINEFMPWPNTGCNEFIELMNLGPSNQSIGCYTVLTKNYAITIPAGTVLTPGQIFLMSDVNTITSGCSGRNSANTNVNLNWTNCNGCVSPSPGSPSDLMTDGGSGSDPVFLLNTSLTAIDGVAPNGYVSGSAPLISIAANNGCAARSVDADTYSSSWENIGFGLGKQNSAFRVTNGDCSWDKGTNISPGTTNNTSSTNSQITLSTSSNPGCNVPLSISVAAGSAFNSGFSYSWTLSKSPFTETYQVGTGTYLPSTFSVNSLPSGTYNLLLQPGIGCSDALLSFTVNCPPPPPTPLPIKLIDFSASQNGVNNKFEITIDADAELDQLFLESSSDAKLFSKVANIPFENKKGDQKITFELPSSTDEFFRLVMIDVFGKRLVSEVVNIKNKNYLLDIKVFPNPIQEFISLQHYSRNEDILIACLLSTNGAIIKEENFKLLPGLNNFRMSTSGISKGSYLLSLKKTSGPAMQFNNLIKQ